MNTVATVIALAMMIVNRLNISVTVVTYWFLSLFKGANCSFACIAGAPSVFVLARRLNALVWAEQDFEVPKALTSAVTGVLTKSTMH